VYSGIVPKERRVLHAPKYHLTGAPDYIIKQGDKYVPVEVKSGRVPKSLHDSVRMQVISAALLVESEFGTRPEKGYVQYPGKAFTVKIAQKSVARLLDAIGTMREARRTGNAPDAPPSWFYCPTCPRVECPRRVAAKSTKP
jgi:CRISPR-associated exonuclease Cas4